MDVSLIALYLLIGAAMGFLAGLLGIGGGMTIVPLLTLTFTQQGFPPEHVVHLALGTATATIMFTAFSSAREHHRHGAVVWRVVAGMAPGMIVGALAGTQAVGIMPTAFVAGFFGVFVAAASTQVLIDRKPKPTRQLPGAAGLFAVGGGIGLVASMVGAGGAFLSVPFMAACNIDLRKCVATSAALGLPIAIAGTIGYMLAGMRQQGLPAYSFGFVYVPALLAIVAASVFAAPFGARAAHRWPVARLRKAFAVILYVLSAYMLWKAWQAA